MLTEGMINAPIVQTSNKSKLMPWSSLIYDLVITTTKQAIYISKRVYFKIAACPLKFDTVSGWRIPNPVVVNSLTKAVKEWL